MKIEKGRWRKRSYWSEKVCVCVGLKKGGDDGNNSGRVKQERRKEKGNW
jgi:hypothetical protein